MSSVSDSQVFFDRPVYARGFTPIPRSSEEQRILDGILSVKDNGQPFSPPEGFFRYPHGLNMQMRLARPTRIAHLCKGIAFLDLISNFHPYAPFLEMAHKDIEVS
jgi:hypothetical protein